MNKARRKAIEKVVSDLYDIQSAVEELRDEEQEYLDNISENLQGSERYELAEQALENLNSAYDSIEEAASYLEEAGA
jgi:t-SNARE complex subunit (syntaxin)